MKEIVSDSTGISPLQECGDVREKENPQSPLGAAVLRLPHLPVLSPERSPDRVSLSGWEALSRLSHFWFCLSDGAAALTRPKVYGRTSWSALASWGGLIPS